MSSGRRRGRLIAGIVVLVVGIGGAVGLWLAAENRLDAAVDGLARGPVGCDTVLDFDETGDYVVFVETQGSLDGSRGDCNADSSVDWSGDELPAVTVTLTDPDDEEVDITADDGIEYHADGSRGLSIGTLTIDQAGDHLLRVESPDDGFYISIGHDPNDGVALMRIGALALLLVGVVVGTLMILTGRRRGDAVVAAPAATWAPVAAAPGWPSSPPGFPAPPPTTGVTGVVAPPSAPPMPRPGAPLPLPPTSDEPTRWGPPRQ